MLIEFLQYAGHHAGLETQSRTESLKASKPGNVLLHRLSLWVGPSCARCNLKRVRPRESKTSLLSWALRVTGESRKISDMAINDKEVRKLGFHAQLCH